MATGDDLLGRELGPYRIVEVLGSGATGVVYRAHPKEGPAVALKVLHEKMGSITGLEQRFRREARILNKLSHPNIVEILDFGVVSGRTYIGMELLEGWTLEDELARGPIDPVRALLVYEPVLEALAVAHEHDVVHRDLKPANVFIRRDGGVTLLDFGLSKMLSIDEETEEGTLTRKGRIVGTPAYMAPEQITGVFVDVRADVYGLGVLLFELLADRRPFLYDRRSELLRAHLLEPIPEITGLRDGLWICEPLRELLRTALAKDPQKRYPDARALLHAMRELPTEAVRLEGSGGRQATRARTGPSSAVISASERQAITESAGLSTESGSAMAAPPRPRDESETLKLSAVRGEGEAFPVPVMVVIAALLLGTAAGLWAIVSG